MHNKKEVIPPNFEREFPRRDTVWDYAQDTVNSFAAYAMTVSVSPPCLHRNGRYNSIPARFWGRRRVFVCTDCGDILESIDKKERI